MYTVILVDGHISEYMEVSTNALTFEGLDEDQAQALVEVALDSCKGISAVIRKEE